MLISWILNSHIYMEDLEMKVSKMDYLKTKMFEYET